MGWFQPNPAAAMPLPTVGGLVILSRPAAWGKRAKSESNLPGLRIAAWRPKTSSPPAKNYRPPNRPGTCSFPVVHSQHLVRLRTVTGEPLRIQTRRAQCP